MSRRKKPVRNLYERKGIWYARVPQPDGSKRRVSTGLSDEQAAREWLRRAERDEQARASAPQKVQAYSLEDALNYFVDVLCKDKKPKTQQMYDLAARNVAGELGQIDVNELHRDHVQHFINSRLEAGLARSTILKERITLKMALSAAVERGLMVQPVESVLPKFKFRYVPRRVFLRQEDLPRLLAALPAERGWWVRVALYSGLRHAELEALDWTQDRSTYLDVRGTKTAGSSRGLPVGGELRATLDEVPVEKRSGRIVERWQNVNRDLKRACLKAGVERITCHDLRHSFGSWLAQAGVSTKVIGELLGHAPGSQMAAITYSFLTDKTLTEAVERLGGHCAPNASDTPRKRHKTATKKKGSRSRPSGKT